MRILLNDVTTTPGNPPKYQALNEDRPGKYIYPADALEKQGKLYPDLKPLRIEGRSAREVHARVEEAAFLMGWRFRLNDKAKCRLEAISITPLLRFRDDVVVEIQEEKFGSVVHVRSKSRLGRDDFGVNAKRIREFLQKLAFYFPKETA
jgi:hypothetical protein